MKSSYTKCSIEAITTTLISNVFRILADAFVNTFHADRKVFEHLLSYYFFDQLILTPTTLNLEWIVNQCPEVYIPLFSNISQTTILYNGINVILYTCPWPALPLKTTYGASWSVEPTSQVRFPTKNG